MNRQYRQGDVLIVEVHGVPDEAQHVPREDGRVVLAHGEVTGHAHAIADAGVVMLEHGADRFLRVERPSRLGHEEHDPIEVSPGTYRVVRQREFLPGALEGPDASIFVGD